MPIFAEIKKYIKKPEKDTFVQFLTKKLKENKNFLQHSWNLEGQQVTLLGYLISQHEEPSDDPDNVQQKDLTDLILETLKKSPDINAGFPLHQAISSKKIALVKTMLKGHQGLEGEDGVNVGAFNFDAFDKNGRSLLSLALSAADDDLIEDILAHTINIHQASILQIDGKSIEMQPIHQAIYLNLLTAVDALIDKGTQLNNSCGPEKNTPVMLAAKCGQYEVLEKLLCSQKQLDLEAKNIKSVTAVGLACEALKDAKTPESKDRALKCIARLLCHGAGLPQLNLLKKELVSHRDDVLQAMDAYLEDKLDLVDAVVNRIHDKNNSRFRSLVYEDNPVVGFFHRLSPRPHTAVLLVESWVTRNASERPDSEAEQEQDDDRIKFAKFVRKYHEQYNTDKFSNPLSGMRGMIASGEITNWDAVRNYAETYPKSRTATVYASVSECNSDLHNELDDPKGLGYSQ